MMTLNEYLQATLITIANNLEEMKKCNDHEKNITDARRIRITIQEDLSIIKLVKEAESSYKGFFENLLDDINEFIQKEIMKKYE